MRFFRHHYLFFLSNCSLARVHTVGKSYVSGITDDAIRTRANFRASGRKKKLDAIAIELSGMLYK